MTKSSSKEIVNKIRKNNKNNLLIIRAAAVLILAHKLK